jgi:hypothetical protein
MQSQYPGGRAVTTTSDTYELSPMQQGMLFHHLRAPASGEYHEQIVGDLREAVEPTVFDRAWQYALQAHPVLRTTFRWESLDGPCQVVHDAVPFGVVVLDWRAFDARTQERRMQSLLADDRSRAFDLARAPLSRVTLVCLSAQRWQFVWSFPHAILDGRSFPLVLLDVFTAYDAYLGGLEPAMATRPSYRNYIEWLRTRDGAADERFWREALQGVDAPTALPQANAGADVLGHDVREAALDPDATAALERLAERLDVGMSTLVYSAWALLLARHAGRDEVTFGVVRAGRRGLPDGDRMTGLFINTLPLRVRVPRAQTAEAWLRAIRAAQRDTGMHEQTALADVRRWSGIAPGVPLFESVVVYDDATLDTLVRSLPGNWAGRSFRLHEHTSYTLALYAYGEASLRLRLVWDRARLDAETAAAVARELVALLRALPHGVHEPLSAFLTPAATVRADVAVAAPSLTTLTTEFPSRA